jgi:single-strand DNA-binding protein
MISATVGGYLSRDADQRFTSDGTAVVSFSIPSDHFEGKDKKTTTWVNCTIWGKRAEALVSHMKKGTAVMVRGSMWLREYTNRDGVLVKSLELRVDDLKFLGGGQRDARSDDGPGAMDDQRSGGGGYSRTRPPATPPPVGAGQGNDDIPF